MSFDDLLLTIAMMSSLVTVGAVCLRTRLLDRLSYAMAVFIFASLCSNMLMLLLMRYVAFNVPLIHLFWGLQVVLLGRLYLLAFADSPPLTRVVTALVALLLAFTILNALPLPDWTDGWQAYSTLR